MGFDASWSTFHEPRCSVHVKVPWFSGQSSGGTLTASRSTSVIVALYTPSGRSPGTPAGRPLAVVEVAAATVAAGSWACASDVPVDPADEHATTSTATS